MRGDPFKGLAAPSGQSPKSSGVPRARVMHIASVQELQEAGLPGVRPTQGLGVSVHPARGQHLPWAVFQGCCACVPRG